MRTLMFFAVAAAIAAAGLLVQVPAAPPNAYACSVIAAPPEEEFRSAALIAIVRVESVGDAVIREPALPASTAPVETATPLATATNTPRFVLQTPTSTPTPTQQTYPGLTGIGARATVVERVAGPIEASTVGIDWSNRAAYERALRLAAVICGPAIPPAYEAGASYLVVLAGSAAQDLSTARRYRIDGTDALVEPPYGDITVRESVYRRYLDGIPSITGIGTDGTRVASVTADRVPLARLIPMLKAIHAGITPPETGSAGLAANR